MKIIRESTADQVILPVLIIQPEMEMYSGWGYEEHIQWINDLTGLDIPIGSIVATNESCSEVWILEEDHYQTKCQLVYLEE